jgi:hypothetical protein
MVKAIFAESAISESRATGTIATDITWNTLPSGIIFNCIGGTIITTSKSNEIEI